MSTRDVSGLWDKNKGDGSAAVPDRSPGIAPPPRRRTEPDRPVIGLAPEPRPTRPLKPAVVDDAATIEDDTAVQAGEDQPETEQDTRVRKTGVAFTEDQLSWLHKKADKADKWLGEYFADLVAEYEQAVAATELPRRTRSRRGSNYIGAQLYLDPDTRERLEQLAATTGQSLAATARALVTAARSK